MGKKITKIVGFLLIIFLAFSISSMFVKPHERDALSIFGLMFPYLFILGCVVFPLLYKSNKILFLIGAAVILFSCQYMLDYVQIPINRKTSDGTFHVMNYNVMVGWKMLNVNNDISKEKYEQFINLIEEKPKADIICTQETGTRIAEIINKDLGYPYIHKIKGKSPAIFSKHPIVNKGSISFGPNLNACLWADIIINSDTLRTYSLHLESNRLNNSSYDFLAQNDYETSEAIKGLSDFLFNYSRFSSRRAIQAEKVKKHTLLSPYPIIISGDLNAPPVSYTYKTLKRDLCDAFVEKGSGIGTTWTGVIPMLRIDYIFASQNLRNTNYTCYKNDLSDHYPIKASFNPIQ